MKVAGVMGGMGPGTTADFYSDINRLAEEQGQANRPEVVVWNVPLNYEVEQELLQHQRGLEKYLPHLVHTARQLENAGADFIAVPCNTVHELYDEFSSAVEIPVLHIVNETVTTLQSRGVGKVALLATGQTVGSNLYQDVLDGVDIECIVPTDEDQEHLNAIVADLVTAEGAAVGGQMGNDADWLNRLVERYVEEVGTVVLGCTDFHIMLQDRDPLTVVDSMQILAEATVARIYQD